MLRGRRVWLQLESRARRRRCLRPARCRVRWFDEKGAVHEEELDGLMATCMQHEIDHLDGILFIDHISRLKRSMVLKKLDKLRKSAA